VADEKNPRSDKDERKERLAAELRANLQRRKAQARSRRAGEADSRLEGLSTAPGREEPK
jgi:hypothetical protein